jgi:diacylglycerol kinase family enzyme
VTAPGDGWRPSRYGWAPADPLRQPVLFVNPRWGGGKAARVALAERARERGIETIVLDPDSMLEVLVAEAVAGGADALGIAGGDGSLAVVAAAARAHALPFMCIPAGTRNHFALDIGVDRSDLLGALDAFTDAVECRIDVAEVNGRLFLNNVSLGIYGDAVQQPGYRDAKLRTLLETAHAVLGPSRTASQLHLLDDRGRPHDRPAVVLVSNNPYALNQPLQTGSRPTLTSGQLGIVVLDPPGDPRRAPGRAWTATSVEIRAPRRLHAGIDGEAVELDPPLELVIRPTTLRVRISSRHPGVSPSGLIVS